MDADILLAATCAATACGTATLRFAWSLPKRSISWNAAGWALFALGVGAGWGAAGAWGVAVASLFGMGAALLALVVAALTSPARGAARASNRRAAALPQSGEPWRLGRRTGTFFVVMLAATIVALGIAIATRSLFAALGAREADANVAGFYAMPLAWALLAYAVLMQERRARQWRLLAICAVPGVLAVVAGMAA